MIQQCYERLGKAYVDGLYGEEDYWREKRALEKRLAGLVVPDVDAVEEAGRLLENLPRLWQHAGLGERRRLLMTLLDAVYVDARETKAIVAIKPKPAFRALFEIATTREGSGVVLYHATPQDSENPEAWLEGGDTTGPCLWWRRGGEPVS